MKKNILTAFFAFSSLMAMAQTDSTTFKGYIYNKEYDVYLEINFYQNDVKVPGQEVFGTMAGYFGDKRDGRKWLITDAQVEGKTAHLSFTNDYGSEDLTADLTAKEDGKTFELKQLNGSTLKIARNRKWVKMPKKLLFLKR